MQERFPLVVPEPLAYLGSTFWSEKLGFRVVVTARYAVSPHKSLVTVRRA